jgi:hypothetical protein
MCRGFKKNEIKFELKRKGKKESRVGYESVLFLSRFVPVVLVCLGSIETPELTISI